MHAWAGLPPCGASDALPELRADALGALGAGRQASCAAVSRTLLRECGPLRSGSHVLAAAKSATIASLSHAPPMQHAPRLPANPVRSLFMRCVALPLLLRLLVMSAWQAQDFAHDRRAT
jgi:hypothetical protein